MADIKKTVEGLKCCSMNLCKDGNCPYWSEGNCSTILAKDALELLQGLMYTGKCKDCKYAEYWYGDKSRCFLWNEDGIDVFNDGYCNYWKENKNNETD